MLRSKQKPGMEPAAVREFRERRGWTHEQMADEVWASPLEVAAWEAGTIRVPTEQAGRIRWLARDDQRRAAVIEAGLPSCAWAAVHAPDLHEMLCMAPGAVENDLAAQRHLGECATCRSVYAFGRSLQTPPGAAVKTAGFVLILVLATVAGIALFGVLRRLGVDLTWDTGEKWFSPLAMAAMVFGITAQMLGSLSRHHPYVAGFVKAVVAVSVGLFYWVAEHETEVTPAGWVLAAVLTILITWLAGRWSLAHEPQLDDDPTADATSGIAASGEAPLLAEPFPGAEIDPAGASEIRRAEATRVER